MSYTGVLLDEQCMRIFLVFVVCIYSGVFLGVLEYVTNCDGWTAGSVNSVWDEYKWQWPECLSKQFTR